MPSGDDKLKAFSDALQRGLQESVELQEDGALEVRKMEENVRSNISAIGEMLKVELSKKRVEVQESIEPDERVASDDTLKNKILELGSILHTALSTAKPEPIAEPAPIQEEHLIIEPTEDIISADIPDFDEEKANENVTNSFAKIANLLRNDLAPEEPQTAAVVEPVTQVAEPEPPKEVPVKNSIINNYVNMLDQISKESPTENNDAKQAGHEMSPSMLKYIKDRKSVV